MIRDMTCEEGSEICINKTQNLLSKAQMLMRDIQELLDWCTPKGPSVQTQHRMHLMKQIGLLHSLNAKIQQNFQASIEEDGETLVIEGFRFESAVSREDLRRLK